MCCYERLSQRTNLKMCWTSGINWPAKELMPRVERQSVFSSQGNTWITLESAGWWCLLLSRHWHIACKIRCPTHSRNSCRVSLSTSDPSPPPLIAPLYLWFLPSTSDCFPPSRLEMGMRIDNDSPFAHWTEWWHLESHTIYWLQTWRTWNIYNLIFRL